MPKLVTKFKYYKPGGKKSIGGFVKYIATREGVEKIDESQKLLPATENQRALIKKLLHSFPDSEDMHEYIDYVRLPTRGNASEFISRVIEDNVDEMLHTKTYADYIATRPRAERFGSHGLFTDDGVVVNLKKVSEELNSHSGNLWTAIVSLRREDAERLGFDHGERWRDMLRTQTAALAENLKIAPENLRWFAAFHNESHHPHVHLIVYSALENEGYLTKQGVNELRSSFARDIFAQDLYSIYEQQTAVRNELRADGQAYAKEIVAQINEGVYENPALEGLLLDLAARLSRTKGKKQYGYLKPDVKATVDQIIDLLARDERIKRLYDLWYEQRENVLRTYTDTMPEREPLRDNREFKPLKNAVIEAAMGLVLDRDPAEEPPAPEESPEPSPTEAEEEPPDPPPVDMELQRLTRQAESGNRYAQYRLAKRLLDRGCAGYAPKKAVKWLEKAAMQHYSVASYLLGKLWLQGTHLPQDKRKAEAWLRRSSAEDNPFAQYLLGKTCLTDEDFQAEPEEIERLLYRAAEQNNRYAAYTLGREKLAGGVLQCDPDEAIRLLNTSAGLGFAPAMYRLGRLYAEGDAVEQDLPRAVDYLERAADQGDVYAAYLAGKLRLKEESIRDIPLAIRNFETAAAEHNGYAEYQLGRIYLYGIGTEKDTDAALRWLTASAEHGNVYASQLLQHMQKGRNTRVAMSAFRLLTDFCRVFQRRMEENRRHFENETDRKLLRKIEEKKAAHGLKQG